jgi:hypothetical protein
MPTLQVMHLSASYIIIAAMFDCVLLYKTCSTFLEGVDENDTIAF